MEFVYGFLTILNLEKSKGIIGLILVTVITKGTKL